MPDLETGIDLKRVVHEENHFRKPILSRVTVFFILFTISLCSIFFYLITEYREIIKEKDNQILAKYSITEAKELNFYKEYISDYTVFNEIVFFSEKYKIEKSLILAIIITESNLNKFSYNINSNGSIDRGIMSLNSESFKDMKKHEFYDVSINIQKGTEYLRWCLDNSDGNKIKAIAMYNVGKAGLKWKIDSAFKYADKVIKNQTIIEEKCLIYMLSNNQIIFSY